MAMGRHSDLVNPEIGSVQEYKETWFEYACHMQGTLYDKKKFSSNQEQETPRTNVSNNKDMAPYSESERAPMVVGGAAPIAPLELLLVVTLLGLSKLLVVAVKVVLVVFVVVE